MKLAQAEEIFLSGV